jgi:hypothetical protein
MNSKTIDDPIKYVPVYLNDIASYQSFVYSYIIKHLKRKSFNITTLNGTERYMPSFENMESFGYTHLIEPLECLNIVYPNVEFDNYITSLPKTSIISGGALPTPSIINDEDKSEENDEGIITTITSIFTPADDNINPQSDTSSMDTSPDKSIVSDEDIEEYDIAVRNMVGRQGLSNIMSYKTINNPYELRYDFEYKPDIVNKYGRIFKSDNIKLYSGKISNICNIIRKSTGIVMIYSQYIDGGVVPLALALEEMGFGRYGSASYTKPLFKQPPTPQVDATTITPRSTMGPNDEFNPARYVMITGDKNFSPNNEADLKYITHPDNRYGKNVKVILITKAAAEGLDFKNIRQIHLLEPWYNMNRIEQIIGRAVRNFSHCDLPFNERNVEIYLHATKPINNEEPADLYVYRFAEKKAIQIGKVTRLLKGIAVDCILNIGQTNFTVDNLYKFAENQQININLSSGHKIQHTIGDTPGTDICDYMENCNFTCLNPVNDIPISLSNYDEDGININYTSIIKRIRALFREQSYYGRDELINSIKIVREYPTEHIDYVLTNLIENKNEYVMDQYGNRGHIINKGKYYGFQPNDIDDDQIDIYHRTVPIDYKRDTLNMDLPLNKGIQSTKEVEPISIDETVNHNKAGYTRIIDELKRVFDVIEEERTNIISGRNIGAGEVDWYRHMGRVYEILHSQYNIEYETLNQFITFHYLDILIIPDKLKILFQLYTPEIPNIPNDYEINMRAYFDKKVIKTNGRTGIAFTLGTIIEYYTKSITTSQWSNSKPVEELAYIQYIKTRLIRNPTPFGTYMGIMGINNKGNNIVFKIRDMSKPNNRGSMCSVTSKTVLIRNIKDILVKMPDIPQMPSNTDDILRLGLCIISEILLRKLNMSPNIIWFSDIDETVIYESMISQN